MATLTVQVSLLPNVYSNVGLTVKAWLASSFIRHPTGQDVGISGAATATATTNSSGTASLTGLTTGTAYWIQVIDPLGYFHWYQWSATLAIPGTLQANVNMPGDIAIGLLGPMGPTGSPGPTGATGATGATGPAGPNYTVNSVTTTTTAQNLNAYEANASGGAFTITSAAVTSGFTFKVTKTDNSANAVTIALSSGTINGSASIQLTQQYQSVEIRCDGTNGFVNAYSNQFDGTAPVTQEFGDSAATGVINFAARRDHKHGMNANGGWIPDPNTWTFSSSTINGREVVVTVNANLTGYLGVGHRVQFTNGGVTQYFIVTAISYGATTTVTLYGGLIPAILNASYTHAGGAQSSITVTALPFAIPAGTTLVFANGDTAIVGAAGAAAGATSIPLSPSVTPSATVNGISANPWQTGQVVIGVLSTCANSAITAPAISYQRFPVGFPAAAGHWTEIFSDLETLTIVSGAATSTAYNVFKFGVLPIGSWDVVWAAVGYVTVNASVATTDIMFYIATSASSTAPVLGSDRLLVVFSGNNTIIAGLKNLGDAIPGYTVNADTSLYLNAETFTGNQILHVWGLASFYAKCSYY